MFPFFSMLQCVSLALDSSMQLLSRQLSIRQDGLIPCLVLLHLAYADIQGTLTRFARLVQVCPDLVNEQNCKRLMKSDGRVVSSEFCLQHKIRFCFVCFLLIFHPENIQTFSE